MDDKEARIKCLELAFENTMTETPIEAQFIDDIIKNAKKMSDFVIGDKIIECKTQGLQKGADDPKPERK